MPLTQEQLDESAALKRLFSEKVSISQREFASRYQIGTSGFLWQLLNGRRPLNLDVAIKFSNALGVDIAEFSTRLSNKQREISLSNVVAVKAATKRIPILSYVQAGHPRDVGQCQHRTAAIDNGDFVYVDEETPDECFALIVQGNSMQPEFLAGDTIIIDPSLSPRPGDFVVANRVGATNEIETTFKKYRPRGYDKYGNEIFELSPLNDDFPTFNSSSDKLTIVGIMIEHRRKYRRRC